MIRTCADMDPSQGSIQPLEYFLFLFSPGDDDDGGMVGRGFELVSVFMFSEKKSKSNTKETAGNKLHPSAELAGRPRVSGSRASSPSRQTSHLCARHPGANEEIRAPGAYAHTSSNDEVGPSVTVGLMLLGFLLQTG